MCLEGSSPEISCPGSPNLFHELFLTIKNDMQEDAFSHCKLLVGKLSGQQVHSLAKLGSTHISKDSERNGFSRHEKFQLSDARETGMEVDD